MVQTRFSEVFDMKVLW